MDNNRKVEGSGMVDGPLTPEQRREVAAMMAEGDRADVAYRRDAQQRLAEEAMKALLLVNGGAMVALFTLVGAVSKTSTLRLDTHRLWWSFAAFALGLFATLIVYLLGFLSQAAFFDASSLVMMHNQRIAAGADSAVDISSLARRGAVFWYTALALALTAAILFVVGAGLALYGFLAA